MTRLSEFPMDLRHEIDRICDDFEDQLLADKTADIEEFLERVDCSVQSELLQELIQIELAYRDQLVPRPPETSYLSRFPGHEHAIETAFALHHSNRQSLAGKEGDEYTTSVACGASSSNDQHPREFGDYILYEQIAAGGMGVVYRAHHKKLDRDVALKMIRDRNLASDESVKRFMGEARAVARLHHPAIVPVHDVGELDGQHYIAMQFIEGRSLADILAQGPQRSADAASILRRCAHAIQTAHEAGVVHRDIKPSNILIDQAGQPWVTDFGLAKIVGSDSNLTALDQVVGSPSYMAPEQAHGKASEATQTLDVYGLGAMFYHQLTGHPPFEGSTFLETLELLKGHDILPPRRLNPHIDRDLETICLKCLRRDPLHRYSSAKAIADDVRRWESNEPILARRAGVIERLLRWSQRNPWRMFACVLAAVVILGGFVSASYFQRLREASRVSSLERQAATTLAKAESEKRATLERLAATNQYFAIINKVRNDLDNVEVGQKSRSLELIEKAAQLVPAEDQLPQLRSLAAAVLSRIDVQNERMITGQYRPFCLAFSPDGRNIAIGTYETDGACRVLICDVEQASIIRLLECPSTKDVGNDLISRVVFSGDGTKIAAASRYGMIHTWDTQEFHRVSRQCHDGFLRDIAFSRDGEVLASCCENGIVRLCHSRDLRAIDSKALRSPCRTLAFDPNRKDQFYVGAENGIHKLRFKLDDSARIDDLHVDAGGKTYIRFASHGRFFATLGSGTIWLATTARTNIRFPGTVAKLVDRQLYDTSHEEEMTAMQFSHDDSLIVTGSSDRTVKIWDSSSGRLLRRLVVDGMTNVVSCFSPDGRTLAISSEDGVAMFDLNRSDVSRTVADHATSITAIDFHENGTLYCLASEYHVGKSLRFKLPPVLSTWKEDSLSQMTGSFDSFSRFFT